MARFKRSAVLILCVFPLSAQVSSIEKRFAQLRKSPGELHAFLYRMPKGADLHNHLSGAYYAENILKSAASQNICVDVKGLRLTGAAPCREGEVNAEQTRTDNALTNALIDMLSMRNFVPSSGVSGHDHFFDTFGRFGATDTTALIQEVIARAADQNESYLELMALSGGGAPAALGKSIGFDPDFNAMRAKLESAGLAKVVTNMRARVDQIEAARTAGCDAKPAPALCGVKVGYIYQVLREFAPEQIFGQVMAGFALAASDPRVVGINFVQPEDGLYSMRDYSLHMRMVDFAKKIYPNVHVALHAGELWKGLVPPDGLRFHIREAVEVGHAERIGHAVDIMFEKDPYGLMADMKAKHIAVEICLTSNDGILGVKGNDHPFPIYRKYGVPVELSTDDEGVSRSDLTQEFERAVMTYQLSYADVKQLARNSIEYSFAAKDEKAKLKADLEKRFAAFEKSAR
jgi:adenosine deaminase